MSSPVRVLFADHVGDFRAGGAEKVLRDLIMHLDSTEFAMYVAIPNIKAGALSQSLPPHIHRVEFRVPLTESRASRPSRFALALFHFPYQVLRLSRFVIRERIDILYANTIIAGFYLSIVARITKKPLIYHEHNFVGQRPNEPLWKIAFKQVTSTSRCVIAISRAVEHSLEVHGVDKDRICVIHNGIAEECVAGIDLLQLVAKGQSRVAMTMPDGPIVGIVANLHRWKGHIAVLETVESVRLAYPTVRYLFIGRQIDPAYQDDLLAFVQKHELQKHVYFLGFQERVEELIAIMDIVVVASDPEPFGLVVLEAMRLGKPVIGTNAGGPAEIIVDRISGLLVAPHNVPAMSEAICTLLSSRELRHSMGAAGQEIVEKAFTISVQVQEITRLLLNLARSGQF